MSSRIQKLIIFFLGFFIISANLTYAADLPYTYTGQEEDSSGLMYYEPELAKFIQPDSLDVFALSGNPQDLNPYAYVR
jgi:RHS repeat-associated protein